MYEEILEDPKLRVLPGELFKTWTYILALASRYRGEIPIEHVSQYMSHRSDRTYREISELINRGLLTYGGGLIIPHNWFGRQYRSDSAAERMRRYRARKRYARSDVTQRYDVTAPDKKVSKKERERAKKWVADLEARLASETNVTDITSLKRLKPLGKWKG